jgi:hypothetical protein
VGLKLRVGKINKKILAVFLIGLIFSITFNLSNHPVKAQISGTQRKIVLYCETPINVNGDYQYFVYITNPNNEEITLKVSLLEGDLVPVESPFPSIRNYESLFSDQSISVDASKSEIKVSTSASFIFHHNSLGQIVMRQTNGPRFEVEGVNNCEQLVASNYLVAERAMIEKREQINIDEELDKLYYSLSTGILGFIKEIFKRSQPLPGEDIYYKLNPVLKWTEDALNKYQKEIAPKYENVPILVEDRGNYRVSRGAAEFAAYGVVEIQPDYSFQVLDVVDFTGVDNTGYYYPDRVTPAWTDQPNTYKAEKVIKEWKVKYGNSFYDYFRYNAIPKEYIKPGAKFLLLIHDHRYYFTIGSSWDLDLMGLTLPPSEEGKYINFLPVTADGGKKTTLNIVDGSEATKLLNIRNEARNKGWQLPEILEKAGVKYYKTPGFSSSQILISLTDEEYLVKRLNEEKKVIDEVKREADNIKNVLEDDKKTLSEKVNDLNNIKNEMKNKQPQITGVSDEIVNKRNEVINNLENIRSPNDVASKSVEISKSAAELAAVAKLQKADVTSRLVETGKRVIEKIP